MVVAHVTGGLVESLNARVYGHGNQTLVLSHGFGLDRTAWHYILPYLAYYFKVVVFDMAFSWRVRPDFYNKEKYSTFNGYADDLIGLLDELNVTRSIYLGHSMSAMVGCIAATQRPHLFEHLILLGGSPRSLSLSLPVSLMVSLRFPFWFSQPPGRPPKSNVSPSISAAAMATSVAAAVTVGVGMGFAISYKVTNQRDPFLQKAWDFFFSPHPVLPSPIWGSLSLASTSTVDPKTGVSFPPVLNDSQRLLGIGLRKKRVLGLKNIDVYAFGVYADDNDIKKWFSKKYGKFAVSELKQNKNFYDEVLSQDICMTVRLQIVYGRLSIRSVRNAFEESVGSRLQKFGGSDNKDLLQRFTSQFKDEYRIPRGCIIDLSKEHGHILRTKIDGKEVGSIQSKLLCRSILDLYIGDEPFDRHAKEEIEVGLASLLVK